MATKKSVRNSRALLAAYWAYKVIGGANPLKTTLNVLLMEKQSADKERQRSSLKKSGRPQGKRAGATGSAEGTNAPESAGRKAAAAAAAGRKAPKAAKAAAGSKARRAAKASAAAAFVVHNKTVRKMFKNFLRSERVY